MDVAVNKQYTSLATCKCQQKVFYILLAGICAKTTSMAVSKTFKLFAVELNVNLCWNLCRLLSEISVNMCMIISKWWVDLDSVCVPDLVSVVVWRKFLILNDQMNQSLPFSGGYASVLIFTLWFIDLVLCMMNLDNFADFTQSVTRLDSVTIIACVAVLVSYCYAKWEMRLYTIQCSLKFTVILHTPYVREMLCCFHGHFIDIVRQCFPGTSGACPHIWEKSLFLFSAFYLRSVSWGLK